MRHLALLALAACHHAVTRAPAPDNRAAGFAARRVIVVVEDGVGALLLDRATDAFVPIAGTERFVSKTVSQSGAYLVDHDLALDLRNPGRGMVDDDDEVLLNVIASGESAAGPIDVVYERGGLELRVGGARDVLPAPSRDQPEALAVEVSPDGSTLAIVFGISGNYLANDIYTIDVRHPHLVRRTFSRDIDWAVFLDDDTLLVSVFGDDDTLERYSLHSGTARLIRLPEDVTLGHANLASTAPLVHVSSGLLDPASGTILPLGDNDYVVAVSPDGRAAAVTNGCSAPGDLRRLTATGSTVLRPSPQAAACDSDYDGTPLSAVFDGDGALVDAIPMGSGWQVAIDGRVVRTSANPMQVFAWPSGPANNGR